MSLCLFERRTPGVQPVPSQQEAMRPWVLRQSGLDDPGQPAHVLVVFDDRQPFTMNVRPDSFEALEHLVAFHPQAMLSGAELRDYRAPDRMSMQDRVRLTHFGKDQVECGLCRGLAGSLQHLASRVHAQKVIRQEMALIQARRCYRQYQGIAANHCAEIAARPESPPPGIAASPQFG